MGGHAQAGFGIAAVEIGDVGKLQRIRHLFVEGQGGRLDIDGGAVIGLDEIQSNLGIVLIGLHAVGQAHGPKLRAVDALHRQLRKLSRQGGILAAGDTQHVAFSASGAQVINQEIHPALHFGFWIDKGTHTQGFYDGLLQFFGIIRHDVHGSCLTQYCAVNKEVYVKVVAGIAALGGLLFGYDTGVMSGALLFISPAFDMSAHQEGWVTSMLLVGAAVGALTAGRIADRYGRRFTLIAGGVIFVLGSIWCALSGSVGMLATARTFLGFAVGAVSIVSPMYIAEIVPAKVRGRMVSLNTLAIVVGQLMAYLVNSALASTGSWEWMLGLAAVPGLALALGMAFLPETPVWLATNGRMSRAQEIAGRAGMDISELTSQETARKSSGSEWKALKANRWMQITVLLAMLMGLTQQITGVNAIVYFAPTMMNQVGISTANSVYTSIVIGTVSVLACWVGLKVVDRIGRKRLLLIGLTGNVISLFILSFAYSHAQDSTAMAMVSLVFMALFIAFQQAAVSPTTWLLISELVPLQVRGLGMGIAGLSLWATNWAVAQYFLPLVEWLTGPVAFIVFGVFGLIAIGYTKVLVPETMGRSLDEVGEEMKSRYERESAPVKP